MELKSCIFIVLVSTHFYFVRAAMHLEIPVSRVSEGTGAELECYSSSLLSAGSVVEWRRDSRFSPSVQTIVRWTRDGGSEIMLDDGTEQYSTEGGIVGEDRFVQTLKIRQTKKTDEGNYVCVLLSDDHSDERSNIMQLTVKYPPADHYPLCTATPGDVENTVTLLCVSEKTYPSTAVQWYKNNLKVADGRLERFQMQSKYKARPDELDSQFECRLVYNNGIDIHVRRSCRFSRPSVAILRIDGGGNGADRRYYAIAHANPPLVFGINCSLPLSSATYQNFETRFLGYGVMTVGNVDQADNGINLTCRAKNAFGFGEAKMAVRHIAISGEETNLSSMVTTFMPEEYTISVAIWPKEALVPRGETVLFVCSYKLLVHPSLHAGVDISWRYNNTMIDTSMLRFTSRNNTLLVKNISNADQAATVFCVVKVRLDGNEVTNHPVTDSSAKITVTEPKCNVCPPELAFSSKPEDGQRLNMPFVIGVSVLSVMVLMLMVVLIIILRKSNKNGDLLSLSDKINPQATYRAQSNIFGANATVQTSIHGGNHIQRTLPAEPVESTSTTTLRSVVTTPVTNPMTTDTMIKSKFGSAASTNSTSEMSYQEMVGDTGVILTRHGSIASSVPRDHPTVLCRSFSIPASMIPGPRGGFIPSTAVKAGEHRSVQRSMSETQDCDEDASYEDPDFIRERRRLQKVTNNHYETAHEASKIEKESVSSQYANSITGDDSVFIIPS